MGILSSVTPVTIAPLTGPAVIDVSGGMVLWTWITFMIVAILLYKVAWKPILSLLEKRETFLRESVETGEKVRAEMAQMDETRRRHEAQLEEETKQAIAKARKAATEAARVIEHKAKEESQILMENAEREIRAAQDKAAADLKRQSAETAVALAARILDEELDENRNRALTDKLLKEM
jgi:F-type H+-transporting ATPase subunit b